VNLIFFAYYFCHLLGSGFIAIKIVQKVLCLLNFYNMLLREEDCKYNWNLGDN
jgi:hypothetical protein